MAQEREGVVGKRKLQDLAAEVYPRQVLDEDTEEVGPELRNSYCKLLYASFIQLLMQLADDFIESVVTSSCQLAAHRKSSTLEAADLQLHLGVYCVCVCVCVSPSVCEL